MCGIAGYFGNLESHGSARELLGRMVGALRHRGPDASGVVVTESAGLAHARLSIIDLSPGGAQPMSNDDGTISITFNGEIFNYVELRDELMARGRKFRSTSDTEVIIRLYEEMGPPCVEKLNGDFAFAIWDARWGELLLARDRMGVRPLYYTQRNGLLYFASEVKALLQVPGIDAEVDPFALDQIFTFWFPLAPRTIFKGISELPPAHTLTARRGKVTTRRYWSLGFPASAADEDARDEESIAEEVRSLLTDATRIRLRSDVPVGSYLSGGLDSSIVSSIARRLAPGRLRTFSVRFDNPEFDESEFQLEMADALGTDHSAILCRAADIGASFPDVIRHTERPILRTAPAPLQLLSALVHQEGYKVVLTGEGADEVFGGYDIFKEAKLRRFCARQPRSLRRPLLFRKLYPYLPKLQAQNAAYLKAFFATDLDAVADPLFSHLPRFRTTAGAKLFFSQELRATLAGYNALDELRADLPDEFARWHPLSQAQYLESAYLLPGYILSAQGDRVAMANAVEGRFPFLDHRVVELAAKIPPRLKMRHLTEKYILRRAARDLVPARMAHRTKQPYRAPDSNAFFGDMQPGYVRRVLGQPAISASGLFDAAAVAKLVIKAGGGGAAGFRDNTALTGILSTQLWRETFAREAANTDSNINHQRVA